MIMSKPYNPSDWDISNLFMAMYRKNKLRKIFNLPEEVIPF